MCAQCGSSRSDPGWGDSLFKVAPLTLMALLIWGLSASHYGFIGNAVDPQVMLLLELMAIVPLAISRIQPGVAAGIIATAALLQILTLSGPGVSALSVPLVVYTCAKYGSRRVSRSYLTIALLGAVLLAIFVGYQQMVASIYPADAPTAMVNLLLIGGFAAAVVLVFWLFGDLAGRKRAQLEAVEEKNRLLAKFSALRVTARLAGQNARQVPGRTTATASALLVGVTLVVTMTVGAATAQRMLYSELAESLPVDGYITATGDQVEETLAQLPQVEDSAVLEGVQAMLSSDSGETAVQVLVLSLGQLDQVAYRDIELQAGQVLVPESFIWREQQMFSAPQEGQQQTARLTPDGTADSGARDAALELEAQFSSWVPASMVVIADSSLPDEGVPGPWQPAERYGATFLRMGEGSGQTEINGVFEAFSENEDQLSLESAYARAGYGEMIDMVLLMVLVLLAAAIIVAVIGVSNTLSLSVFERRREAALLRAVGMNRRAVGSMISLEALLMAAVALLLGTVLGGFFGWAGVSSLVAREDWSVVLEIPWVRVAAIWAATLVAALLAAWLPARQMSRVQPASGLSQQ